jgi:hypothetical protein
MVAAEERTAILLEITRLRKRSSVFCCIYLVRKLFSEMRNTSLDPRKDMLQKCFISWEKDYTGLYFYISEFT